MDNNQLFKYIDHTLLKPDATIDQIETICQEALDFGCASACIPPAFAKPMHSQFPDLNVCVVIGFPLGYSSTASKVFETSDAIANGANEIDMVININEFKSGNSQYVLDEIDAIKDACGNHILKVIVETALLTPDEIAGITKIVSDSRADYIKTSTGFSSRGAEFGDIEIFNANRRSDLKMKAAGGIKSVDDMLKFVELGCSRLGTSSGVKLLTE